jgi:hypothetical protein
MRRAAIGPTRVRCSQCSFLEKRTRDFLSQQKWKDRGVHRTPRLGGTANGSLRSTALEKTVDGERDQVHRDCEQVHLQIEESRVDASGVLVALNRDDCLSVAVLDREGSKNHNVSRPRTLRRITGGCG